MKKSFLILVVALLGLSIGASAQTTWEWGQHGVGFSTPDDFKIITNNNEEFTAENDNLFLSLSVWQDASVTEDNLADALVEMAGEMQYDDITEGKALDYDGFVGYGLRGTKDGVYAMIAALLDENSGTNLFVVIVYPDGHATTAENILMSIYPTN